MRMSYIDPNPLMPGIPKRGQSSMDYQDGLDSPPRPVLRDRYRSPQPYRCEPKCEYHCTKQGGGIRCKEEL